MKFLLAAPAIGVLGGVTSALCGVGGGVVMVPAFVLALGLPQKVAVATSLAVIVPTALVATVKYARAELVDWRVFAGTVVGAAIAAFVASHWVASGSISNEALRRIFGIVLVIVGAKMLITR